MSALFRSMLLGGRRHLAGCRCTWPPEEIRFAASMKKHVFIIGGAVCRVSWRDPPRAAYLMTQQLMK